MSTFNGVINFLNVDKICRICLSESKNMKSVYSRLSENDILEAGICNLSDVLAKITSIAVSFRNRLCVSSKLYIWNCFRSKKMTDFLI